MRLDNDSEFKTQRVQGPTPRQPWARLAIVLSLTVLYIAAFPALSNAVGPVGAALVSIPVATAGWYFGIEVGLVASILGIVLSALLRMIFAGSDWFFGVFHYWPGNLMVVVIGYLAGRLHKEFAEDARVRDRLRSRERFLVLISMVTKSILDPKNPGNAYYSLIGHLANLFVADYAYLTRWDEAREQATLIAATKSMDQQSPSNIELNPDETTMITTVLQTKRVMIIEDVPNSLYIVNPADFRKLSLSTQSALCIPLIMGEYEFGVATLAFDTPRRFSREEIIYAELASNQIALALWTFEQQLEIRKRLKEANALARIERALSESERVGIETIFQLIVDSAKDLIPGAEYAVLHLIDNEQKILMPRAVAGFAGDSRTQLNMRVGEGIAGQVIQTGKVAGVSDTQNDSRFLNRATPAKFRSLIVAPIESNERRVGTISVQSERPNAFTPAESQLLGALGTQAAIAIENATLLETTGKDLKEINALYRVNRGLASTLDPDQLMKDVVELLQHNFGYYHVQAYVVESQSRDLVARHGSGIIGDQLREQEYRLPVGMGIVGYVVETGKPFVTNNVDDVVFFSRNPLLPDTNSELTVPIKSENQVVGVLDIQQVPPGRLTERDMQLVTAVADQLAVALQKANLYTELQASLHQEKTMRSQLMRSERLAVAGRLLASVSHELNNPLQAIQNALFLLKDDEKLSAQGLQDLEVVLSETERMAALIARLRATYRPAQAEDFQEMQLNNIVEDVYALTATYMRHRKIAYEFCPERELPVILAIPDQIRQVILNLFINAIDAMSMDGQLTVQTRQLAEQGKVLLSVTDTGSGINPEILPHIFEPFVTDKETGTGLGLTITYDIIRQHQGDIQAENHPQGGATFMIWLPIRRQQE